MIIASLLSLVIALYCYACSQLQQHNKLRWQDDDKNFFSFWGKNSWVRKYAGKHKGAAIFKKIENPNWYYRFFKLKYKERFPLSATFLVNLTDGFHMCQSIMFLCLSLSFSIATGLNFFLIWGGVLLVHFLSYRLLQK